MAEENLSPMQEPTPKPKERLALVRFEVICHIKTLRSDGLPLAECLRAASSRPWPGDDGQYYSYRTIETWWYAHGRRGFAALAGKARRADAGKSRAIDEETSLWIIDMMSKSSNMPITVLYPRFLSKKSHKSYKLSALCIFSVSNVAIHLLL
jgi:hypothetical protein